MIKYIKREDLDIDKYNACIASATNSRIYALSVYLDIVADNWDVLIKDDYRSVMPLPWRSKYLIKYIYPPNWTQQLGIFSEDKIDTELVNKFLKAIPSKYLKTTIQFNSDCTVSPHILRSNYILSLNKTYFEISSNYRKDRKDRLKKFLNQKLEIKEETQFLDLIELFKRDYGGIENLETLNFSKLNQLSTTAALNPSILKVYNEKSELISGSLFLRDTQRLYYLFSANNVEGKKRQANSGILDYVIRQYAGSDYTLDFEGSMIPGIASFFKSFGSNEESYYQYSRKLWK